MASGKNAEYKREWYLKNKERILAKKRAEYEADPDSAKQRTREYRKTPKGVEARKRGRDKYQSRPEVKAARAATQKRREALKHNAALLNGDEWNDFVIQEMYLLSKVRELETGVKWHVDHIVPLNGQTVNGLHVWYNLRVITAHENCTKSNKLLEGL